MAWVLLVVAGVFEAAWATALKESEGLSKLGASVIFFVALAISMFLLGHSMRTLPLGTAYAIWTGIGAIGGVIIGIAWYKEPADLPRLLCVGLIIVGILGLKWFTPEE